MANAAIGNGAGYFIDTLVAQRGFYGQNFGWGFNFLLAITTNCVGFGKPLAEISVNAFLSCSSDSLSPSEPLAQSQRAKCVKSLLRSSKRLTRIELHELAPLY